MTTSHVGMIGLAVMGANLARNIERNGFPIVVYNRTKEVTDSFMKQFGSGNFTAASSLEDFVSKLTAPRQIFMMVKAGPAVDALIDDLSKYLSPGDILIDGGNTWFKDTQAREAKVTKAGFKYLGVGVSGGEEGALHGPSLMPGGPKDAWKIVAPLLEKMSAKADGQACTTYIGPDGAGHFVMMVHNGIEYGDMQLIAEAYDLLKSRLHLKPNEIADIFTQWNQGVLSSFLIEITAKVLKKHDDKGEGFLVDKILDKAGQKGTGKWTSQVALDLGVPIPTIAAAVDARGLSAMKSERLETAKIFSAPKMGEGSASKNDFINAVHDALYCSKIIAYAQGMRLLSQASQEFKWDLKLDQISAIWKGGCIIRAKFLEEIRVAYSEQPKLTNLMISSSLSKELTARIGKLREVLSLSVQLGISTPAFSSSLAYFDAYRTTVLPQNLTQAQRDFFGAHTYERVDMPGSFHTEWEE